MACWFGAAPPPRSGREQDPALDSARHRAGPRPAGRPLAAPRRPTRERSRRSRRVQHHPVRRPGPGRNDGPPPELSVHQRQSQDLRFGRGRWARSCPSPVGQSAACLDQLTVDSRRQGRGACDHPHRRWPHSAADRLARHGRCHPSAPADPLIPLGPSNPTRDAHRTVHRTVPPTCWCHGSNERTRRAIHPMSRDRLRAGACLPATSGPRARRHRHRHSGGADYPGRSHRGACGNWQPRDRGWCCLGRQSPTDPCSSHDQPARVSRRRRLQREHRRCRHGARERDHPSAGRPPTCPRLDRSPGDEPQWTSPPRQPQGCRTTGGPRYWPSTARRG
ncbi:MAG: hypothetical protein QOJ19_4651 [Acidimicrobiia bacterium]|nr:hypothetical protein [Acidimicrobiia bacterium]